MLEPWELQFDTPSVEHRIGELERDDSTGNVTIPRTPGQ